MFWGRRIKFSYVAGASVIALGIAASNHGYAQSQLSASLG